MGKIALLVSREEMLYQAHNILQEKKYEIAQMRVISTDEAVIEARRSIAEGATIIIARGLQASLMKQYTDIPVVEIVITAQEMALLIVKAKQIVGRDKPVIAVIGFKNMFCDMSYFDTIYEIELRTYYSSNGAKLAAAAREAVADGADLIIGGDTAVAAATEAGVPSLFLSITEDSLKNAFSMAEHMNYAMGVEKRNAAQMETLLGYSFNGVLKISGSGLVTAVNPVLEAMLELGDQELKGRSITAVFPEVTSDILREVLQKGEESYSLFMQVNQTPVFAVLAPVLIEGRVDGAILTCHKMKKKQPVDRIQKDGRNKNGLIALGDFRDLMQLSKPMQDCIRLAKLYSMSERPVLILGETGTEKLLMAQSIHNSSLRSNGPFLSIHCDGLPEEQQMEAVFGEKGAAAMADGGTLMIEEADKLSLSNRHRLYRLIHYQTRTGKELAPTVRTDVRVIATAGSRLADSVNRGEFREDLYYLLNGLNVLIPAIRDRKEDLRQKISDSMKKNCDRYSRYHILTNGARKILEEYPWPGNLLQIDSFFERLILTAQKRTLDEIAVNQLLSQLFSPLVLGIYDECKIHGDPAVCRNQEAEAIYRALERFGGNREKTAKELGISKATLWRHMKKYGITEK